jgi:hypothetical protein
MDLERKLFVEKVIKNIKEKHIVEKGKGQKLKINVLIGEKR